MEKKRKGLKTISVAAGIVVVLFLGLMAVLLLSN